MAKTLEKLEKEVEVNHLHLKHFHIVNKLRKSVQYIRRYTSFVAVSYLTFSNELHYLWSYPPEFHQIFTRYSHIFFVVNAHI